MEIFLIRHGETGGNIAHRHQAEDTPLSDEGQRQAERIAQVVKEYEPTHLVSSNLVRAIETARIIGDVCDMVPDTNEHVIELVRPDYMYGHYHRSFKSVSYYLDWYLGKDLGGESYEDLRKRFRVAQESLAKYPKDARLVVVSHAVFINLFLAHMCLDKPLNPFRAAIVFKNIITMPNTHLTPILFDDDPDEGTCAWSVNS